ncbi:hypothetical protein [Coralloluteibacterium thermophilus]|uniref:ATP synthase subunit I n=1 Tax=Coralloluteibacterium thermophilum TaxID=2707049 RepID=A0ABV9NMI8_9GAMM
MAPANRAIVRNALLLPAVQIVLGLVGAVVIALLGHGAHAKAFLVGAAVVAAGFAVFGWRTGLQAPVVSAGRVFARLLVGSILKWVVIGVGLALAMAAPALPAAAVFAGAVAAYVGCLLCLPWLVR